MERNTRLSGLQTFLDETKESILFRKKVKLIETEIREDESQPLNILLKEFHELVYARLFDNRLDEVVLFDLPGEAERLQTHPGHTFLAYQGATFLKSFTVTAPRGGWQEFEL